MSRITPFLFPAAVALLILAGGYAWLSDRAELGQAIWLGGLMLSGAPLVVRTAVGLVRGRWAADLVAAIAIVSALALGQGLAGLVVVLMQSGGESLEQYAAGRATRALRALEERAPRVAHRFRDADVEDVAASDVAAGDRLLIRPGELVPSDAIVEEGRSHIDTSAITGEPVPRRATPGTLLLSGTLNQEGALVVRATAAAAASQYARIVELVRSAQRERAPIQRIADRYAVWFTPIALAVAGAAVALSGDWGRGLAVLVIATPCPLILATPVAMLAGIDLAARRHLIVRSGGALEALDAVTCAVFDKTGTVTIGRPAVRQVTLAAGFDETTLLRLAGAVERHAGHMLARSVVEAAVDADIDLPPVTDVIERPGLGVTGRVDGHTVSIGSRSYLRGVNPAAVPALETLGMGVPGLRAGVMVDGRAAGMIEFADRVREDARRVLAALPGVGVDRSVLLSGDHASHTEAIGRELGFREVRGDLLPEGKVAAVRALEDDGERVMMVGDGTNDAPALAAASVGIAIGGRTGAGIATEAADVVVLAETAAPVLDALRIGRRTLRIARQSIVVGLGLSGAGMIVAAFGYIPPAVGAFVQEAIDVAVILNALRAASLPEEIRPRSGKARRGEGMRTVRLAVAPTDARFGKRELVGAGVPAGAVQASDQGE